MSKRDQEETLEAPPDSGTERLRTRAEPEAESEFETEEERLFFSVPPAHDEEHTLPSLEPVVAESDVGDDDGPERTPAEHAWLARAEARRATLQRWVAIAIVGGAAALVVAGADRYLNAKTDTASRGAPAVLLVADPTPPQKTNATPSTADASGSHGAPSSTSLPVALPPATPSHFGAPASVPAPPASATSVPVSVPSSAPSAASLPVVPAASMPSASPVATGASPAPSSAPSAVAGLEDAAGLREKARARLATGHSREGVAFARAAIERDPADARSYVLLGAGLQDLGEWAAARDVFHECTLKAKRGSSGACQYFARR